MFVLIFKRLTLLPKCLENNSKIFYSYDTSCNTSMLLDDYFSDTITIVDIIVECLLVTVEVECHNVVF